MRYVQYDKLFWKYRFYWRIFRIQNDFWSSERRESPANLFTLYDRKTASPFANFAAVYASGVEESGPEIGPKWGAIEFGCGKNAV